MENIEFFTEIMKNVCAAEVMDNEEASQWLNKGEDIVIAYRLPDKKINYYFITVNDARLLSEEEKEFINHRESPFNNVIVIIYKNANGALDMRIENGLGDMLARLFNAWKTWKR